MSEQNAAAQKANGKGSEQNAAAQKANGKGSEQNAAAQKANGKGSEQNAAAQKVNGKGSEQKAAAQKANGKGSKQNAAAQKTAAVQPTKGEEHNLRTNDSCDGSETSFARHCSGFFTGDTIVLMADGSVSLMNNVKVGSQVNICDSTTDHRTFHKATVSSVFRKPATRLVRVNAVPANTLAALWPGNSLANCESSSSHT